MKRSLRVTAIGFVALLTAVMGVLIQLVSGAYATTITLVAKLAGANEVPAVNTPGTGQAVVVLDTVLNTMAIAATFGGLRAGTTASHIHCCLPSPFLTGVNVGVATTSPTFPGFPLGVTAGTY